MIYTLFQLNQRSLSHPLEGCDISHIVLSILKCDHLNVD